MTDTPSIQLVDLGLYHRQFLARDLKSEQKLLFCLPASPVLAVAIDASRENQRHRGCRQRLAPVETNEPPSKQGLALRRRLDPRHHRGRQVAGRLTPPQ